MRLPYLIEGAYLVDRSIPADQDAPIMVSVQLLGERIPPYVFELRLREGPAAPPRRAGQPRRATDKPRSAVGRYDNEPQARAALQQVYDAYRRYGRWRIRTPEPPPDVHRPRYQR